jgi:DUF1009 family protein
MSAAKESSIRKLGIIAGGGTLPLKLIHSCEMQDIEVFIIGFEGQTNTNILGGHKYLMTRIGAAGQIIKTLKAHEISDLVLVGSIRRPSLTELKPDLKTIELFTRLGLRSLGDDSLLKALRVELEKEGFKIHGVQTFATGLLIGEGPLGKYKPKKQDMDDIDHGIMLSQNIGKLDIGQSIIIQEGIVLGVEAVEGTDALIRRCKPLKREGRGGVLIKTCKPQQDKDLDLPTIGPETIIQAVGAGLVGVVFQANSTIILDAQQIIELANKHKIFVYGYNIKKMNRDAA